MISLKKLLNELDSNKIFHIEGTIIIDNQKRDVQDILSDVRALPGITIVRNVELPQDATSRYFRSSLEIKVDPYPYIKQNNFDSKDTLETVVNVCIKLYSVFSTLNVSLLALKKNSRCHAPYLFTKSIITGVYLHSSNG